MAHVEAMWMQLTAVDKIEQLALELTVLTDVQTVVDRTLLDLGEEHRVAIVQTVDAELEEIREGLAASVVQELSGVHHLLRVSLPRQ
jgi:hypothetical protein